MSEPIPNYLVQKLVTDWDVATKELTPDMRLAVGAMALAVINDIAMMEICKIEEDFAPRMLEEAVKDCLDGFHKRCARIKASKLQ